MTEVLDNLFLAERHAVRLDAVLQGIFAETQALVHVVSGELKASGRVHSQVTGSVWEGTIAYGGPGVPQAIYEIERGGNHDYTRLIPSHYDELLAATGAQWP